MRFTSIVIPVLVASSICGAYFAGRYIGEYDAEKLHSSSAKTEPAFCASGTLQIVGAAIDFLHDSKSPEATRVLEQYAKLQVPAVAECLKSPECSPWVAPTSDSRATLQRYVAAYRDAPASAADR